MIPSAVTLDFYGTVVGSDDAVIAQVCAQIAASAGPPTSADEIARSWGERFARACEGTGSGFRGQKAAARESLVEVLASVGSTADPDLLLEPLIAYWRRPPLPDDARDFLRRVEVPVCLVSNIDRADLEAALSHHGIVFDHVVTSDDVRAYKPRPEMFRRAMALLGVDRAEVLHVGDSRASDVAGATALGIPVAWVNRGGRARPAGTPLWAEVPDLTVLADRLERPAS